jgi:hypothetical protein
MRWQGALVGLALAVVSGAPAAADDDPVTAGDNSLNVHIEVSDFDGDSGGDGEGGQQNSQEAVADEPCVVVILAVLLDPTEPCDLPPEVAEEQITADLVATAFRTIPLPPSQLQVQPANGRTLVNFETNFFTDTAPFDRTVTLLGQQVDLHIVPSGFGWRFGDGAALSTDDAGAPYPDLRITHTYERKGDVAPAVDTTYTATYRVNDGPWADVPGSVTVPGAPVALEVLSATPVLVGY